jgi:hypothetical protein
MRPSRWRRPGWWPADLESLFAPGAVMPQVEELGVESVTVAFGTTAPSLSSARIVRSFVPFGDMSSCVLPTTSRLAAVMGAGVIVKVDVSTTSAPLVKCSLYVPGLSMVRSVK